MPTKPFGGTTSEPGTSATCASELAEMFACLEGNGLVESECLLCYKRYRTDIYSWTTCGMLTTDICSAIGECTRSCSPCQPSIERYEACFWGPDCVGACPPSDPPSTTAPSTTMAPSPISATAKVAPTPFEDFCVLEEAAIKECVNLNTTDAVWDCNRCVYPTYDGLFNSANRTIPTCGTIHDELCPKLAGECPCGACLDEIRSRYACWVATFTTGCELRCGGGDVAEDGDPDTSPRPAPAASSQAPSEATPTPNAGIGEGASVPTRSPGASSRPTPSAPSRAPNKATSTPSEGVGGAASSPRPLSQAPTKTDPPPSADIGGEAPPPASPAPGDPPGSTSRAHPQRGRLPTTHFVAVSVGLGAVAAAAVSLL